MPDESKTFLDVAIMALGGALVAASFRAIKIARAFQNAAERQFDIRHFIVSLISAGGTGALVSLTLDAMNVNKEISIVIISMSGYIGGSLLDIVAQEVTSGVKGSLKASKERLIKSIKEDS